MTVYSVRFSVTAARLFTETSPAFVPPEKRASSPLHVMNTTTEKYEPAQEDLNASQLVLNRERIQENQTFEFLRFFSGKKSQSGIQTKRSTYIK